MVQFWLHCPEANLDIAKTLSVRELRKGHDPEMILAGECLDLEVASVPIDAGAKSP